ncbi:hypothetical protein [Vulgatibacter sp.]|uniref:hypothetical protein n=1 Tax=Vulgatibacter sp. TaxID=1971226 RepID=UPI003562DEED
MRALLSTRLFAAEPLDHAPLRMARDYGFTALELHAEPRHFDVFHPGEARRIASCLQIAGVTASWLHIGPAVLNQLTDERKLAAFADVVRGLRLEVVTASTHSWGVREDGTFLDLDALKLRVQANGARLVLDLARVDERVVRRLPSDLGLCWDMAGATSHDGDEQIREVDEMLEGVARGRLLGVRVAHLGEDGKRSAPDRHEATLLEEVWRLQAPGTLIYDVDDPSGFGAAIEVRDTLEELRSFHAGEKRAHPEGAGGVFWAGLAPG